MGKPTVTWGDVGTHNDAAFYPHVHLLIKPHLDPGPLQNDGGEQTGKQTLQAMLFFSVH